MTTQTQIPTAMQWGVHPQPDDWSELATHCWVSSCGNFKVQRLASHDGAAFVATYFDGRHWWYCDCDPLGPGYPKRHDSLLGALEAAQRKFCALLKLEGVASNALEVVHTAGDLRGVALCNSTKHAPGKIPPSPGATRTEASSTTEPSSAEVTSPPRATKKPRKPRVPISGKTRRGVIAYLVECLRAATRKKPLSKEALLARMHEHFPERAEEALKHTISAQLGYHLPKRGDSTLSKSEKGYWLEEK